ncbi:MAG: hypothetical protein WC374_05735 [Phycisphaerae bacterium]|jgi:hypothetical protein
MEKNEINDEIVKPRSTSLILCTALQSIGWVFLFYTAMAFVMTITGVHPGAVEDKQPLETVINLITYWFVIDFILLGASVVIFGQLARLIFQKAQQQPGVLLRWGSRILIVVACISVFWLVWLYRIYAPIIPTHLFIVVPLFFGAAMTKAAVLMLLAQILKRALPIIEESKSLV